MTTTAPSRPPHIPNQASDDELRDALIREARQRARRRRSMYVGAAVVIAIAAVAVWLTRSSGSPPPPATLDELRPPAQAGPRTVAPPTQTAPSADAPIGLTRTGAVWPDAQHRPSSPVALGQALAALLGWGDSAEVEVVCGPKKGLIPDNFGDRDAARLGPPGWLSTGARQRRQNRGGAHFPPRHRRRSACARLSHRRGSRLRMGLP